MVLALEPVNSAQREVKANMLADADALSGSCPSIGVIIVIDILLWQPSQRQPL